MSRQAFTFLLTLAFLGTATACAPKVSTSASPPLPGLARYSSDRVEIWLPSDYQQIDPKIDFPALAQKYIQADPENAEFWQQYSDINPDIEMVAIRDLAPGNSAHDMVIFYAYQPIPPPPANDVVQSLILSLPPSFHSLGYREASLPAGPALRLTVQSNVPGLSVLEDVYLVDTKQSLWMITFASPPQTFHAEAADFEDYVTTFRVLKGPSPGDYLRDNVRLFTCCGSLLLLLLVGVLAVWIGSMRRTWVLPKNP